MELLISVNELRLQLQEFSMKYSPEHSEPAKKANNELIRKALHYLLGTIFTPEENLTDYILLAHVSGLKLHLSLKKNIITSIKFKEERNDYNLDDETMLLNLQGWSQREFLPILMTFQLHQYFKNSAASMQQIPDDRDVAAIEKVILEELWITANAFRIVEGHYNSYGPQENKAIATQQPNDFVKNFLLAFKKIIPSAFTVPNAQENTVELLFPCGITTRHAIYLSLFCKGNMCDIRVFNAGLGYECHATTQKDNSLHVLPYYVGSTNLANTNEVNAFSQYLQQICVHSYVPVNEDNRIEKDERITDATNAIYNLKNTFNFKKDPFAEKEQLPSFPQQLNQDTCVTYSFFAWWYCRDGQLSYLKNETINEANSVYGRLVDKLHKFAVTTKENKSEAETSGYLHFLNERAISIKKERNLKDEILFKLKNNIKNYVLGDKEQELYTPLDGKYLDNPTESPFPLYEKILEFIQDDGKQSLPLIGDAGTGKTQFAGFSQN